jgi:diaminopimelate decarboxylase
MHYFIYKKNHLYCENFKVKDLAQKYRTPLYVYSAGTILDHFYKIKKAFSSLNPLICYSVKANSNLSILKLLVNKGAGLDIVSGGELYRARIINCPPQRIVYASVGKIAREIKEAIKYGILMFNVESLPELKRIDKIALKLKKRIQVSLRVNPHIEANTHSYISTAIRETKFGIDIDTARSILLRRTSYKNLNIVGIHIHIGSQITHATPFIKAIKKIRNLIKDLGKQRRNLKYINIGGGMGIVYDREKPQTADEFARKVVPLLQGISLRLILEPGRFIVGNAGALVTKVIYIKDTPQKRFIIVDAAMNDLIRPSLYGAHHKIVPLTRESRIENRNSKLADVVGPICESGDFLGKSRLLDVKEEDCLAVLGAGAYGFSMSSNYNSRLRPAEVLVKGNKAYLIRKRETYKDLVRGEYILKV